MYEVRCLCHRYIDAHPLQHREYSKEIKCPHRMFFVLLETKTLQPSKSSAWMDFLEESLLDSSGSGSGTTCAPTIAFSLDCVSGPRFPVPGWLAQSTHEGGQSDHTY